MLANYLKKLLLSKARKPKLHIPARIYHNLGTHVFAIESKLLSDILNCYLIIAHHQQWFVTWLQRVTENVPVTKSIIENTEMILSEKETSEFTMEKDNLFSKQHGQVVFNVWLVFPLCKNLSKMNSPLTSQWRGTKQTHAQGLQFTYLFIYNNFNLFVIINTKRLPSGRNWILM